MSWELRLLQVLLVPLGIVAVIIGSMIFFLGTQWTIHFFESGYALVTGSTTQLDPREVSASIDNEFRFYAVFWFAFGVLTTRAGWFISSQLDLVPILLGLFFLGGLGRVFSIFSVGIPHDLMILLMTLELLIPMIGVPLVYIHKRKTAGDTT